jgi:hypothetical protein
MTRMACYWVGTLQFIQNVSNVDATVLLVPLAISFVR